MEALIQLEDGRWQAEIDPGDGTPSQKFYGETQNDVVKELIKAQSHATRKIREQGRQLKSVKAQSSEQTVEFKPRPLTADEQFNIQHNPTPDALKTVIEAELGAPVEVIRQTLQSVVSQKEKEKYSKEAAKFLTNRSRFITSNQNEKLMLDYLTANSLDYNADNLIQAYDDLVAHDLLQLKSEVSSTQASVPVGRPRSTSTGLPANGSVATRTKSAQPVGLTVKEIQNMSTEEYRRQMNNPSFVSAVNKLFQDGK